ncbi:aspartyl-tRNA synthetase [Methylocystis sp. Sn-Cys]|uniref:aspartyl-tRNA synthetase n=1 Tax=Methylocystis sp. Sn-Cys TaxID=1701263 RepID=UPI001920DC60|nr:aspartyl-tRNA synthetase [Methylocystis sp. Sn-Cys]MBL1256651.1 aspartyl-tRNA synthetase [Methylocystis sp. Sn-Cys]
MTKVVLNTGEIQELMKQPAASASDGGFQALMVRLQSSVDTKTGELDLSASDLERIPRYAFDYNNGGWEDRLIRAFGRTLGPKLGRP